MSMKVNANTLLIIASCSARFRSSRQLPIVSRMVPRLLAVTFALGIALVTIGGCSPPTEPAGCQTDADCEDDGIFCNGEEVCNDSGECISSGSPCSGDEMCSEDEGRCQSCLADSDCEDDGIFCNGMEACDASGECVSSGSPCADNLVCNEAQGRCQECLVDDECESDGLICNGEEVCNDSGECVSLGSPCNEGRMCNEAKGRCQWCLVDDDCEDDGIFCNGEEVCDDSGECVGAGSPCEEGRLCNEDEDYCHSCLVREDCFDGNPCTSNSCVEGYCRSGVVDCGIDAECNPDSGLCELPDGTDSCMTLCLQASPSCEEVLTVEYGDFETTLEEWSAHCIELDPSWPITNNWTIVGGECENGTLFLYRSDMMHPFALFFSGDTGEFIGLRSQSDAIGEFVCWGFSYWPMWIECENPIATVVECSPWYEVGDRISLPSRYTLGDP